MLHAFKDFSVVEAGRFGDQVELVGDREFEIAIGVVEQLGELGLHCLERHKLGRDGVEQRLSLLLGLRRKPADDLRHAAQLFDAVALRDALRAERHLQVAALPLDMAVDPVGGAGEQRRAQDQ